MSGIKYDQGKPRMSLLSPIALRKMAQVMTMGAVKYSDNNWRGGFPFTRLLDAIGRHINQYESGQTLDIDSGQSHLSHAACGLMMLLEFEETRPDLDDRYFRDTTLVAPSPDEVKLYTQKAANESDVAFLRKTTED